MKMRLCALACSALTALTGSPIFAQTPVQPEANSAIRDIIVTARRTSESLQNVPVAVTGLDSEAIANLQIQNFGDMSKVVPNLDTQRQFGSANAPQFYLRGVSTGSLKFEQDAGIGLYIDGVYLGRPAATAFNLAEIERIEVLRGPQGTLFGRNSTGGAINFITAAPSGKFGVKAEGTVGNFARYKGRISVDLPALGPITARVTYLHDENRGFVRNLTPGRTFNFAEPFGTVTSAKTFGAENTDAVSVAVRLDLDPLTVDYKFDYTDKVSTQLGQQLLFAPAGYPGIPLGAGSVTVPITTRRLGALPLDFTSASRLKVQGHSLTVNYELSDVITLKSITAYRKFSEAIGANDIDGGAFLTTTGNPFTPLASIQDRRQHQWSEEAQVLAHTDALDFVLGGFYFVEKGFDNNPVFLSAAFPTTGVITPSSTAPLSAGGFLSDYFLGNDSTVRNKSYAGYAHMTYRLGEQVELAGGVRYTKDNRRETLYQGTIAPPTQTFNVKGDHWDWDATATYIFSPRVRTYLRFATGYLSGGVLNGVPFKQEEVKSYEAGLKADFLDNTFRINAAIFQADRKNLQVLTFNPSVGSILVPLDKERDRGYEIEMTAVPTAGLTFNASLGYLDAKLSQALGPRQSLAPKYTFSHSGQYDLPAFSNGSFVSLRYDVNFKDNRFSDPVPTSTTNNITQLNSRVDVGARIALNDIPIGGTKARISLWGQNITDNDELEFARDLGGPVIGVFQVPRTYGVDFGFIF
ncbi:TonB-dependent receptor [Sphingobium aromaticivastans]|uniref:TonB-dependent receptor n=1 Tax=Sphingobium aromaticivastans TaxID=1778665 RepID=UPI00301AC365